MIEMVEGDFIELVTELAEGDDCTNSAECCVDSESFKDCANCWAKRLSKIIRV